jgi:hypothetical protein
MNIWLEIGACAKTGTTVTLDPSVVRELPALSDAFSAVQMVGSNKRALGWDYSSRISPEESDKIKTAIRFAKVSEDSRSMIFSADVSYCDTCYSLRLFFEKSQ